MHNTTDDIRKHLDLSILLLETSPLLMRTIRSYMRERHAGELSVPQYRVLAYLHRHPGVTLSAVAEHMGLTLSGTSRLVDGLVTRGLLSRHEAAEDRRTISLHVTDDGQHLLDDARDHTLTALDALLTTLSPADAITIQQALSQLRAIFQSLPTPSGAGREEEQV